MTPQSRSLAARLWPVVYDAALNVAKAVVGARITVIDEGGGALLQGTSPIIMAANHQGHLDYDTLMLATPAPRRRRLRYVSSELLLNRLGVGKGVSARIQRRLLSGMFTYVHRVIPVGETVRGDQAVEAMASALAQGDTVVIFPEGERNKDRPLSPLRRGIAAAGVKSAVPILPIRIDGTRNAMSTRGLPTRSKPRITVRLREPIRVTPDESVEHLLTRVAQSLQTPGKPLRRSALLIGSPASDAWYLPRLLSRCGFDVDVITTPTRLFRTRRHIRTLATRATTEAVLTTALEHTAVTDYDWVIPVNDDFLASLRTRTDIPEADRLRLAPVTSAEGLSILSSKIGVSLALAQAGLPTPAFAVVHDFEQAQSAAQRIGYPVMLKEDCGHSGVGVTQVNTSEALRAAMNRALSVPMLLQATVPGDVIDMSGVFRDEVLVHATYSVEVQRLGEFGPSSLREYRGLSALGETGRHYLDRLGHALHLNGFTSITAIDTPDKGLTFIEVDVRPNAWVGLGRTVGDDPEVRLQAHLPVSGACAPTGSTSGPHMIGNPLRRPRREVLLGRHRMWRTFPVDSPDAWMLAVRALAKGPIGPEAHPSRNLSTDRTAPTPAL